MSSIRLIHTPGTAIPLGHYSQAVVHNGLVFVSGQVPVDLASGKPVVGTIEEQTELTLRNLERILQAAGSSLDQVVQMTIFIADIEHWGAVNAIYKKIMGDHRPARAIVPVNLLHHGAGIEIQAMAAVIVER